MKTVLDLLQEFAFLNDAKVRNGGRLVPGQEKRWRELKAFYDLLMAEGGLTRGPVSRRVSAREIRSYVTARERLRVPAEIDMVFKYQNDYLTGVGLNVSQGGVFLASGKLFPVGDPLTLFLTNLYTGNEAFFEAPAKVAWVTKQGIPEGELPPGMGVRLVGIQERVRQMLDALVVETLERRLSGVDANALAPDFLLREELAL